MDIRVKSIGNAPSAQELQKHLEDTWLSVYFEVADAQRTHWQNDQSTLVLRLRENTIGASLSEGITLAKMLVRFNVDEFDTMTEDYRLYYRFWWD